jgi:hypothetical protein
MLRKSTRDSVGTGTSRSGKDDNLRDQVAGLKYVLSIFHGSLLRAFVRHIVQELQKENSAHVSKIKSLENENKLLHSETEELKEVRDSDILHRRYQPPQKGCKIARVHTRGEHCSRRAGATARRSAYRSCKCRCRRIATSITGESGQIRGRFSGTLWYQILSSFMFRESSKDCARECLRQSKRVIRQSLRYDGKRLI